MDVLLINFPDIKQTNLFFFFARSFFSKTSLIDASKQQTSLLIIIRKLLPITFTILATTRSGTLALLVFNDRIILSILSTLDLSVVIEFFILDILGERYNY